MNQKIKNLLKAFFFCLFVILLLLPVLKVFTLGRKDISAREAGFKNEPENSLDAVFIGSSHVYTYFQPPLAWNDHGIAVYSYTVSSMQNWSLKYRIAEARKTQKDPLFIVNINDLRDKHPDFVEIHRNIDNMPWFLNRVRNTAELIRIADLDFFSGLEFYLPIIRFHSRWPELTHNDFVYPIDPYKGAGSEKRYLNGLRKQTELAETVEQRTPLSEKQQYFLNDFLAYIEKEHVRVLFVRMPTLHNRSSWGEINTIEDQLLEKGYQCLDLIEQFDLLEMQTDTDYSDSMGHANVHGAIKVTEYITQYLAEYYEFTDKRHQPGWESWDKSAEDFLNLIRSFALDFEITHEQRDYDLAITDEMEIQPGLDPGSAYIRWAHVSEADGYLIYRRSDREGDNVWKMINDVSDTENTFYSDNSLMPGNTYDYLVVPYAVRGGKMYYGKFSPKQCLTIEV